MVGRDVRQWCYYYVTTINLIKMTRSHKVNSPRRGSGSGSGSVESNSPPNHQQFPHYYVKRGPVDTDRTKLKKGGGGKGNWGRPGNSVEIEDSGYNLHTTREYWYHPNSSSRVLREFRTKFEEEGDGEQEEEQDEENSVDFDKEGKNLQRVIAVN